MLSTHGKVTYPLKSPPSPPGFIGKVFLGVWAGGRYKVWMASEVLEAGNVLGQVNRPVWFLKDFCRGTVGS